MKLDRDKLIRAREMLGYGVEKTAEEAGVSKNSVLRAEHEEDIRPGTARKIASALRVQVADLIGEQTYPKERRSSLENSKLMDHPEVHTWLIEQGHMDRGEFLDWAHFLGSSTDDEEKVLQAIDDGIQELLLKRSEILRALRKPDARKLLFPIPPGLSKAEIKRWILKPPGRWELENEIRREYSSRVVALMNYSQQLLAEGKSSGYLSYRRDDDRHEQLLEHRRKVLEEIYAKAAA